MRDFESAGLPRTVSGQAVIAMPLAFVSGPDGARPAPSGRRSGGTPLMKKFDTMRPDLVEKA